MPPCPVTEPTPCPFHTGRIGSATILAHGSYRRGLRGTREISSIEVVARIKMHPFKWVSAPLCSVHGFFRSSRPIASGFANCAKRVALKKKIAIDRRSRLELVEELRSRRTFCRTLSGWGQEGWRGEA